ncbi:hypothetical protein OC834_002067 [Tilletia horrida]|nr:hypothetical protein OC834_002067 [Tilletia horrida]
MGGSAFMVTRVRGEAGQVLTVVSSAGHVGLESSVGVLGGGEAVRVSARALLWVDVVRIEDELKLELGPTSLSAMIIRAIAGPKDELETPNDGEEEHDFHIRDNVTAAHLLLGSRYARALVLALRSEESRESRSRPQPVMAEDAYKIRPGGSLKFKDGSGEKKKKKSKSSTSAKLKEAQAASGSGGSSSSKAGGSAGSSSAPSGSSVQIERTDAERRFDEVQKKRLVQKVKTEAKQSHKEKVDKFNTYLESLSEHYDIPKVGPG